MSQSSPAPVLVTEDLLPDLVGKLIVMVDTADKPGVDVGNNKEDMKESDTKSSEDTLTHKEAEDAKIEEVVGTAPPETTEPTAIEENSTDR